MNREEDQKLKDRKVNNEFRPIEKRRRPEKEDKSIKQVKD